MTKPDNQERCTRRIAPSTCEHPKCGGVFARNPWAPDRPDTCESCGAGRHWERRAGAAGQALLPGETPAYDVPNRLGPPIRDFDGERLSAEWLLEARFSERVDVFGAANADRVDKNYGKRKAAFRSLSKQEGTSDDDGPDDQAGSGIPDRSSGDDVFEGLRAAGLLPGSPHQKEWSPNDADTAGFLRAGGWHPRKAGTTGRPRGRPITGLRGDRLEDKLVNGLYVDMEYFFFVMALAERGPDGTILADEKGFKLGRRELRKVHEEVVRRVPSANTKAVADHLEVSERKVRDLKTAVRAANSPKGGRMEEMNATGVAVLERLDRIEKLESMRAETMDSIRETVERIAERFFDDERIQRAAEDFLFDP